MKFAFAGIIGAMSLLFTLGSVKAGEKASDGYRVLAADKGRVAILDKDGKVEWEVPNNFVCHDIQLLKNGNIVFPTSPNTLIEMTPDKKIVWQHKSKPQPPYTGTVEIHGFQRLDNGLTVIGETGNRRIIEVTKDDTIVKEIPLTIDKPDSHRDVRMVRKIKGGHYLVCHEGDATVREYDGKGKVVWSYKLDLDGRERTPHHDGHGTEVFGAIRIPNGNTLIACGNGNRVIEVTPKNEVVWKLDYNELPGIRLYWVTTLQYLPNGNLIVGNTHAGPDNPQLFEVTRDKKVVWTFKNWEVFGNDLCASQVLDTKGVIR